MTAPNAELAYRVLNHLAALGAGPIEIAASLHHAGIRGQQRNPTHCPISIYLTHQLGLGVGVVTSPESVHITTQVSGAHLPTPLPTSLFVRAFDRGMYPHLIAEQGRVLSTVTDAERIERRLKDEVLL